MYRLLTCLLVAPSLSEKPRMANESWRLCPTPSGLKLCDVLLLVGDGGLWWLGGE